MTHYTSEIEHEGPFETERDLANWPSAGKIDFVDVNVSDLNSTLPKQEPRFQLSNLLLCMLNFL